MLISFGNIIDTISRKIADGL